MRFLFVLLFLNCFYTTKAQFDPQADIAGSKAIHRNSTSIKSWASTCNIERGYLNIANKALGKTTIGSDLTSALGKADGDVVSLGDSGIAIIAFAQKLYNGIGPDFVVFENGFANPTDKEQAFLELAFVEVSSDGEYFVRFNASSLIDTAVQIAGAGDYTLARKINNLAGKYIAPYGVPFDLDELKGTHGLDVDQISHIRIIDVIGSIGTHHNRDHLGNKINDPYPTPFPSGGFDLDAVGAIHIYGDKIAQVSQNTNFNVYPNPASSSIIVNVSQTLEQYNNISFTDINGKIILTQNVVHGENSINIESLEKGIYFVYMYNLKQSQCIGKFIKI